ncbi:MAG: rRNA maturation RNase YbeY [Flavobacteriales bacterium]|nr:MAG: rRNA maturation RNase YbeY [Flavobacteriales bacterium]
MIAFQFDGVPDAFRHRTALRRWLTTVAQREGRTIAQLTYVLLTDKALLTYNRQYLQHDEYTDIITFDTRFVMVSQSNQDKAIHGDILISYDRVKENAATYGVSAQHELHRVMVHGLLHLCGHGDKTDKQRAAMRGLEDKYLRLLR